MICRALSLSLMSLSISKLVRGDFSVRFGACSFEIASS